MGDKLSSVFRSSADRCIKISLSIIFAILLALVAILPSISSAAADGDIQRILTIGMASDVFSLNPFVITSDNEYWIIEFLYDYFVLPEIYGESYPSPICSGWCMDGLTAAGLGTDFSSPSLVYQDPADWPSGSIWEYNLTEDIYWNDGEELTAEDVEWTINLQIGPNFATFWAFQPTTKWILHAEAEGDHKVRVFFGDHDTKEPTPIAFGAELGLYLLPKHAFVDKPLTYVGYDWDGFPVIGSGPFKGTQNTRDELIARETLTLVRNQYYNFIDPSDGERKGLGGAYNMSTNVDKIVIKFFSEKSTQELALRTGQVDMTDISPETYLSWVDDPGIPDYLHFVSELSTWQYSRQVSFNAYPEATGALNPLRLDPVVHRASSLATNKTLFVNSVYKGLGVEGVGLISPFLEEWWWEPGDELSTFNVTNGSGSTIYSYSKPMKDVMGYDPDLANEILDRAGYEWTEENGKMVRRAGELVGERLHYLYDIPPDQVVGKLLWFEILIEQELIKDSQISDFLRDQWSEVGIQLTESEVTGATWGQQVYEYAYEVVLTYWSSGYDPNYLCYVPTSYSLGGWNEFGTDSAEYDALYLQQAKTLNYTERKYWVDECTKWQYLSGSINTLIYPELCSGYSEKRWINWGEDDWLFTLEYLAGDDVIQVDAILLMLVFGTAIAAAILLLSRRRKKKREEMDEID